MIELTEQQRQAVADAGATPLVVLDTTTMTSYVLLRQDIYERLTSDYDDGPWTDEERDLLAAEVDAMLEDDMAVEDNEEALEIV